MYRGLRFGFFFCHLVAACAANPRLVDHTFAFSAVRDSPGVTVLDYRYGSSDFPGTSNTEERRKQGRSMQGTGTTGPMPPGEFLYVKWRINSTNDVYERTVDLRNRLPRDLDGKIVYFMISGSRLNVYVISRGEKRLPDVPPTGPRAYQDLKTVTVYSDPIQP